MTHENVTHDHNTAMPETAMQESAIPHASMSHDGADAHAGHAMDSMTMPADGAGLDHSPQKGGVNLGHARMVEAITISTLTGEMVEVEVSEVGMTDQVMVEAPELQADV